MKNINYSVEVDKSVGDSYMVKLVNNSCGIATLGRVSKSELSSNIDGVAAKLALNMNLSAEERNGVEKYFAAVQSISKELSRY